MNKKIIWLSLLLIIVLIVAGCSRSTLKGTDVTIYKSFSCGCCDVYSKYMNSKGFNVNVINSGESKIKDGMGVPASLQTCHTTKIGNYFVEGHMPLEAVEKLMAEKPDIKGIALPGMPSGSPGMPGAKTEPWVIYAVHKDGSTTEFMRI